MPATLDPKIRNGIGASQISMLFGVSPFGGPLTLYQQIVYPDDWSDDDRVQMRGHRMEPYLLDEYASRHNVPRFDEAPVPLPSGGSPGPDGDVYTRRTIIDGVYDCGTQRHPEHDFLIASSDAIHFKQNTIRRHVEAKTVLYYRDDWMDPDEVPDGAPLHCLIQTQQQMACGVMVDGERLFGEEAAIPACVTHLDDFREYFIPRDRKVEAAIVGVAGAFWHDHVLPRKPPEWDGSEAGNKVLKGMFPAHRKGAAEWVGDDHEAKEMARTVAAVRKVAKAQKVSDEEVFQRARAMVADGPGYAGRGWKLTWNQNKKSVKTDWEALALRLLRDGGWQPMSAATEREETQALIDKFTTTKPGARVLRATFK